MQLSGFDANQVGDMNDFSAIPEGQYVLMAIASEEKPNSKGTGTYLQFTFEVLDGPHKGAKVWARINLNNPSTVAVDIAQKELGAICRAVGVIKPKDSAELHNRPLLATVKVEKGNKDRENNVITKYEPVGGVAPTAPAVGGGTAPWRK